MASDWIKLFFPNSSALVSIFHILALIVWGATCGIGKELTLHLFLMFLVCLFEEVWEVRIIEYFLVHPLN